MIRGPRAGWHERLLGAAVGSILLLALASRGGRAAQLIDDCDGPSSRWIAFHDAFSSVAPSPFLFSDVGHLSKGCARVGYELTQGIPHPYAGLLMSFPRTDATTYEGVRFWTKGEGKFSCLIPTLATKSGHNHYGSPFHPTPEWSLAELRFGDMIQTWGKKASPGLTSVIGVQWNAQGRAGDRGWICVDDVELYRSSERRTPYPQPNPVVAEPKVNQLGYAPGSEKYCVVTTSASLRGDDAFAVRDAGGQVRYSGQLGAAPIDDLRSTGELVLKGEFTKLDVPGTYVVEVKGQESAAFEIKAGLYLPLFRDALRCFRAIRCGAPVADPVAGVHHAACHLRDAPAAGAPAKPLDLTGGWHNAGDCGKWTHMAAISCAWMLWLDELRRSWPAGSTTRTALTSPDVTDLLGEARFGLEWLLKMQRPDGSVFHKVDHEGSSRFGTETSPDVDPEPYDRYARGAGTIDAANFVGVMGLASRVFRTSDPGFAERTLSAARRSWTWLEAHPAELQKDPFYVDANPAEEKLWALGEMARVTDDPQLRARFTTDAAAVKFRPVFWMCPQFFGYMAQALDPGASQTDRAAIVKSLVRVCGDLVSASEKSGYGVTLRDPEYNWGSNESLLNRCGTLLFAHHLTGQAKYRTVALRQMNYLLGINSLGLSFVTGRGQRAVAHPHHWTYTWYRHAMPGWASGGPNSNPSGVDPLLFQIINRGTPPAKCFYDGPLGTSYASNEGQIAEEAALLFSAGYLSDE